MFMKKTIFILVTFYCGVFVSAQNFSNLIPKDLLEPTDYYTYVNFLEQAAESSELIELNWMTNSFAGKKIPYVLISEDKFTNPEKIRFMIFASQHGNEPSGKEALLVLIKEFAEGKHNQLIKNMDLILVPQVNPDGGELKQRLSFNNIDLNRTHINLRNPETEGLHKLFSKYLPQVTLDVHETYYYHEEWLNYGFIKTYIQQLGILNNPNVDKRIIDYSQNKILPSIKSYVEEKGFSFHNYILGDLYKGESVRHSNSNIYDGRQSFGILNTLSFLIEGKNGRTLNEDLNKRRNGQYANILGLLEYISDNAKEIKSLVENARNKLKNSKEGEVISIRSKYKKSEDSIDILMHDINKDKDTVITYPYQSEVVSTLDVQKPKGYLIEKQDHQVIGLLKKHDVIMSDYINSGSDKIYQYVIVNNTITNLNDKFPDVKIQDVTKSVKDEDYLFVPINQLASNFITMILEPQSMEGINTKYGMLPDRKIEYLLDKNNAYRILRVQTQ